MQRWFGLVTVCFFLVCAMTRFRVLVVVVVVSIRGILLVSGISCIVFVDCHECWPVIDFVVSDRWRHEHSEVKYHENKNFHFFTM